ncbi:hypothetical protein [Croceimicrobium hydrocarbonivorans]|uniref:Uncharacterized protein n=1 Tax=Croceimicrobium hydrocarbonivorans TaxID=2761580 RepID=A0A7H0VG20_9FLAO|nr:hypothetical protein [Croceimicrobium hydrocarbonivorans]QNR24668.1 hypothetical protein H4K34_02155 [Croceimicrobium hydrocarbonivorans]
MGLYANGFSDASSFDSGIPLFLRERMKDSMTEKEVKQAAIRLLKEGKSHQDVFQALSLEISKSKLLEFIRHIPSRRSVLKYDSLNGLVILILLSMVLVVFWATEMFPMLVWSGLALVVVLRRMYKYYLWISGLSFFYILSFLLIILFGKSTTLNTLSFVALGLNALAVILLSYLNMKMLPRVKLIKERRRIEGVDRIVQRVNFE